jgi:D-alanine--D-alanine ligase
MDKALLKRLFMSEKIPTVPFLDFSRYEWQIDKVALLEGIRKKMPFPVFVKPTHLGSSVGVSKVTHFDVLEAAITKALSYDTHCLVEEGLQAREIEFAVMGNHVIESSFPGEIDTKGQIYDYRGKYGPKAYGTIIPAPMDPSLAVLGVELAKRAYKVAGCCGLARVDTFLDQKGNFWLNEINPLPGFTSISLYPKAWEKMGLPLPRLLDRLLILGLQRKRWQDRFLRTLASVDEV